MDLAREGDANDAIRDRGRFLYSGTVGRYIISRTGWLAGGKVCMFRSPNECTLVL